MRKKCLILILILVSALSLGACVTPQSEIVENTEASDAGEAEEKTAEVEKDSGDADSVEDNPFNIRATSRKIDEHGIPTPAHVAELELQAKALLDTGDCEAAVPALEEYAKQANWLANIVAAGLEPFYRASYDDRKKVIRRPSARALTKYEDLANQYKQKRNRAMVMEAECLVEIRRREEAVGLLMNVLRLIPVDDDEWWTRARNELYNVIKLEGQGSSQGGEG